MTPKTGNGEPQQNYRLGTVSNELLGGQPHPQFLKWMSDCIYLF